MLWWAAVLVATCACNSILGIDPTDLTAAAGRPPPACPALGGTPTFYGELHQLPAARDCVSYSPNVDLKLAAARCNDVLSIGPLDEPLAPITASPLVSYYKDGPHLEPDGDHFMMVWFDTIVGQHAVAEFARGPDDTWTGGTPLHIAVLGTAGFYISNPTAGTDRRMVYQDYDYSLQRGSVVELADRGAGWKELWRYSNAELFPAEPTTELYEQSLSPDGLRMVFTAAQDITRPDGTTKTVWGTFYSDRATLDDHFTAAREIPAVPPDIYDPYLTPDCGRVYFEGLGTIFYLE